MAAKAKAAKKKQEDLPGMEDRQLDDLEQAATSYAGIRDQRMELNKEEIELKGTLLTLMKKHGKETYKHDGIEINIVHEEETVKVKVAKEKEEEED